MLAYLISEFNRRLIESHSVAGRMPEVMFGYARYIVMPGFGKPDRIVSESELCDKYEVTTTINKRGRYCVISK